MVAATNEDDVDQEEGLADQSRPSHDRTDRMKTRGQAGSQVRLWSQLTARQLFSHLLLALLTTWTIRVTRTAVTWITSTGVMLRCLWRLRDE